MQAERQEFVEVMAGNRLLPGMEPAAHCYCGHQFGNFAGQLGDGAVIYLGQVLHASSAPHKSFEMNDLVRCHAQCMPMGIFLRLAMTIVWKTTR